MNEVSRTSKELTTATPQFMRAFALYIRKPRDMRENGLSQGYLDSLADELDAAAAELERRRAENEPFPDPDVTAIDSVAEPEASNDWGIREAFKTIERYIKPGSALPGAVLHLKREIRKLEKWVMEESGKRTPSPTDPIPVTALQIAMEAGEWFDRKDLSLPEREAEVVKILERWRAAQPPRAWQRGAPPDNAFAFQLGEWWIELPTHPAMPSLTKAGE